MMRMGCTEKYGLEDKHRLVRTGFLNIRMYFMMNLTGLTEQCPGQRPGI